MKEGLSQKWTDILDIIQEGCKDEVTLSWGIIGKFLIAMGEGRTFKTIYTLRVRVVIK
jgi:hypothetical protein